MTRALAPIDDRQPRLFEDPPPRPPRRSDRDALYDMLDMIETLEAAKSPPWSARLLGWQRRRVAALSGKLTAEDAATLTARFEAECDRLGPPED